MSIKTGDRVRFLNDTGGGTVTRIIDRLSVMVENEFGFEVPTPIKELVVIEEVAEYTNETNSNRTEPESKAEVVIDTREIFFPEVYIDKDTGDDINVYFAFVPQERPGNSDLDIYLINDSNYNILYSIVNTDNEGKSFSNTAGMLEANTKEQTESMALQSVNQIPEYVFQFIFYRDGEFNIKQPLSKSITINPVRFYKERSYKENDFFEKDAILVPIVTETQNKELLKNISGENIKRAMLEKEKKEKSKQAFSRKKKEKEILEVDLHIHELLDDFRGLTPSEILEIQMEHFRKKLDEAKKMHIKRIVFIHGVGGGTLKLEIRKELDRQKKALTYQDASFKEYGYGATMVQLK